MKTRKCLQNLMVSVIIVVFLLAGCAAQPPLAFKDSNRTWDYVALGDSIPAGYGAGTSYVNYYAKYIEADLGVTVKVYNWSAPGYTTRQLVWMVQNNQVLRDTIREAEVITIWTGWNDIAELIGRGEESPCGDEEDPDMDCIRQGVSVLEGNIDTLLSEILLLRGTDEALIRIADNCNHSVGKWKDAGVYQQLKGPLFEDWSQAIVQIASNYDVPVVHTYSALNGENGDDEIPSEYLWHDGIHFSEQGHILIADLHRDLGYDNVLLNQ